LPDLNSYTGYPSTDAPALITVSVLCITPKSISFCPLFTSRLYRIIDQPILGVSGWERETVGLEHGGGPSVKMIPKIAPSV
uniref:Uncharacterized protein n=1 Tax=Neovison vison TaxID=452646 RepID=A0A8C7B316_NEOVI